MADSASALTLIPSVEKILTCARGQELLRAYGRASALEAVRAAVEALRASIRSGASIGADDLSAASLAARAHVLLDARSRTRVRPVVNATGVVLHTNLGRALLAESAAAAALVAAREPVALEYEVEEGRRGDRDRLVEEHLVALTGAEAATVVNNNAAAVLLALNTLADGREAIVSRGELIEIGGSFRIPDVMAKSGARLREVGTTNRTHASDYERAIGAQTALILKVHTSNYRIVGFTAAVELRELRRVASAHEGVLLVEDLGAGALVDLARFGLPPEPVVADRIAAGADLVTFSGDKLLGGPQCGIVAGRRDLVGRLRANPLKRALRCDKMTLAALEETLRIYRFEPAPHELVPTLRMLVRGLAELDEIAAQAAALLREALGPDCEISVEHAEARTGSGSQPDVALESRAVVLRSRTLSARALAERFRAADPPIIGRIEHDRFLLDVRTIADPHMLVPAGFERGYSAS